MLHSQEQITAISPDQASLERAEKLATARKWRNLQSNGQWAWGECKSSGAQYYKTAVLASTTPLKFTCNCASRKRPCKHGLALGMLLINQSGEFKITELLPDWLKERIAKQKTENKEGERTPEHEKTLAEARLKAREKRLNQMAAGLRELEIWLQDILRQGLANAGEQGEPFWQEIAARMVDAKLGGIGKRVMNLSSIYGQKNWHEAMLRELADIYLMVKGFQNLKQLPPTLQNELLNVAGINYKKDDLQNLPKTGDIWLIVGQTEGTDDDSLYHRKTWLFGEETRQYGLFLDFAFGTDPYPRNWQVGKIVKGEMIYYPSAYPQRMLAKDFHAIDEPVHWTGSATLTQFAEEYAEAVAANPWLASMPVFLENVVPVFENKELKLVDLDQKYIVCRLDNEIEWKILALSGGYPIHIFGEWKEERLQILSAIADDRFVHFTKPPLERKSRFGGWY